jgi:hypothetical protein
MQMISPEHPSLAEQIAWLRDRAADAKQLRDLLVTYRDVNADKAQIDAEMWQAVLNTLDAIFAGFAA